MKIKKGDTVEVISGDDKDMRGEVHRVLPKEERVIVAGVNMVRKHQRPTGNVRTQAGIVEMEAPLRACNVALVCPHCDKAIRVGYVLNQDGTKSRVCRKCGEMID